MEGSGAFLITRFRVARYWGVVSSARQQALSGPFHGQKDDDPARKAAKALDPGSGDQGAVRKKIQGFFVVVSLSGNLDGGPLGGDFKGAPIAHDDFRIGRQVVPV